MLSKMPPIQIAWNRISTNQLEETSPFPYSPLQQSNPHVLNYLLIQIQALTTISKENTFISKRKKRI